MKTPVVLSVALATALLGVPARADVTWRTGALEPLLAEARAQSRLVLIDFGAEWCVACQELNHTAWNRADITSAVQQGYVPVQVDADTPVGAQLMQRYHVGALPTILVLRADGTEVDRLVAYSEPGLILTAVGGWRRGQNTLTVMTTRLTQAPTDTALRLDVGTRYAERGDEPNARLHLLRVIADDPQNAHGHAARAMLALGDRVYVRSRSANPARAIEQLQPLVARFPATESARNAYVPLAQSLHRAHRDAEARAALDAYLADAPADVAGARANAVAAMMLHEHWDLARAEQVARTGLTRAARDHALMATLAEVLFEQGRAADAVEAITRATAQEPGNAQYRTALARYRGAAASPAPTTPSGAGPAAPTPTHQHGRPTRPHRGPRP